MVERFVYTEDVGGSSPSSPTNPPDKLKQNAAAALARAATLKHLIQAATVSHSSVCERPERDHRRKRCCCSERRS
ncbi:hypothetical protein MPLSOD_110070 [Mesorhizobium sp. SOD10]|nr:hypothetical protein MPLSOD_110070 [Mesorhizobium sp. SOD10]